MESFKRDLRSVLLANNNRVLLDNLNSCYYNLTQRRIGYDYKKYSSLEEFLRTLKDTCEFESTSNGIVVSAVVNSNKNGIKNLVQNQKKNGKRVDKFVFSKPLNNIHDTFKKKISNFRTNNKNYQSADKKENFYSKNYNKDNRDYNSKLNKNYSKDPSSKFNKLRFNSSKDSPLDSIENSSQFKETEQNTQDSRSKFDFNKDKRFSPYSVKSNYSKNNDDKSKEGYGKSKDKNYDFKNADLFKLILEIKKEKVDYKSELIEFLKRNSLPEPKFINTETPINDGKNIGHFCQLFIGQLYSYRTDIVAYETTSDAENAVSRMALDELKNLDLSFTKSTVENDDELINNTLKLLEGRSEPVLDTNLNKEYVMKFKKTPKNNWIEILKNSNKFTIDESQIGSRIYYIISIKTLVTSIESEPSSTDLNNKCNGISKNEENEEKEEYDLDYIEDEIHKQKDYGSKLKSIKELPEELPEELVLPKDFNWSVMVLNVEKDAKICLRLIDEEHSKQFDKLVNDLEQYYIKEKNGRRANKIVIGNLYIAKQDGVFRVKAKERSGNLISCSFVDDGFTENVNIENLYEIEEQFLKLPFQAFKVSLKGFESAEDIKQPVRIAIEKYFEFKTSELGDPLCLIAKPDSIDPIICTLYDTSNNDIDINLNNLLPNFIKNYLSKYKF